MVGGMNVTAFDKSRRKIGETLASATYLRLRRDISERRRAECATCVCSMWREPGNAAAPDSGPAFAIAN